METFLADRKSVGKIILRIIISAVIKKNVAVKYSLPLYSAVKTEQILLAYWNFFL